jgi:hypothetical protein
MGAEGEVIMNDMINDPDEYTQDEPETQAEPNTQTEGYDIDTERLFPSNGMSTQEEMTAAALATTLAGAFPKSRGSAKGRRATCLQRTRSFAKLGWRYQPIPFAVPSKRDSTIGERWANSFTSGGIFVRNHSKAIEMISPFPRDGALSMPSVASSKDHLKRSKTGKLAASRRLTWENLFPFFSLILAYS